MGKPPPQRVRCLSLPVPRVHVHFDEFFILNHLLQNRSEWQCRPHLRCGHVRCLHQNWLFRGVSGPKAVMEVQRPIASQLPPHPWTARPQPVPDRAGDPSKIIATDPVVRGHAIISVPHMAMSKSTSPSSRDYSIKDLKRSQLAS